MFDSDAAQEAEEKQNQTEQDEGVVEAGYSLKMHEGQEKTEEFDISEALSKISK